MDSNTVVEFMLLLQDFTVAFHGYVDEMHLRLADIDDRVRAME